MCLSGTLSDTLTWPLRSLAATVQAPCSGAARKSLVWHAGLPEPQPGLVPRVITYQRKRANRRIVNEEAFIRLLRELGEVHTLACMT